MKIVYQKMRIGPGSHLYNMLVDKGLQCDDAPVQLNLDSRVNVFTGDNGTGKTTLLTNLCARFLTDSRLDDMNGECLKSIPNIPGYDKPVRKFWQFETRGQLKEEFPIIYRIYYTTHSFISLDVDKKIHGLDLSKTDLLKRARYRFCGPDWFNHKRYFAPISLYYGIYFSENMALDAPSFDRLPEYRFLVELFNQERIGGNNYIWIYDKKLTVAIRSRCLPKFLPVDFSRLDDESVLEALAFFVGDEERHPLCLKPDVKKFLENKSMGEKVSALIDKMYEFYVERNAPKNTRDIDHNVLLLDEIQTGLSPKRQRQTSETIRDIVEHKQSPQIFIATHSPLLIADLPDDTIVTSLNSTQNKGQIKQYRKGDLSANDLFHITGYDM